MGDFGTNPILDNNLTVDNPAVDTRTAFVRQSIAANTVPSLERLCLQLHVTAVHLVKFCAAEQIEIPAALFVSERIATRDTLVANGASTGEIAQREAISRQGALNYIVNTGQYAAWMQKRAEKKREKQEKRVVQKQLQNTRQTIVDLLYIHMLSTALHGSFAEQKAAEYLLRSQPNKAIYSFAELVDFFTIYEQEAITVTATQLRSSPYLSRKTGLHYRKVLDLLRTVGLRSDVSQQNARRKTPKVLEPAIGRGIALDLGEKDIAYFLGINAQPIIYRRQKSSITREKRPFIIERKQLNYRTASIICESLDCGAGARYISKSYGITMSRIQYVKTHREEIDTELIRVLRILYDNPLLDKPYKVGFGHLFATSATIRSN